MDKAYLLQHSYDIEFQGGSFEESKIIGIYSTKEKAEEVVERYKGLDGFKKYPASCFYIDEYKLDEDNWTEGFVGSDEIYEDFKTLTLCFNKWIGIQKTAEESWEDDDYYQALCKVDQKVYVAKDVAELAEHIKNVWSIRYSEVIKSQDEYLDIAEKILESLKLR